MARRTASSPNNKWLIMVYISADRTLADFAVESLKQLRKTADERVIVAAQFDPDGSEQNEPVLRYLFDKKLHSPCQPVTEPWPPALQPSEELGAGTQMTDFSTLTDFINWAMRQATPDRKYCLILWGHGPELLFEPASGKKRLYFTPLQLKLAIQESEFGKKGAKLSLIGLDACSMSLAEYACELHGVAERMVASQDDVPDPSFPYDELVSLFHQSDDVDELCKAGVNYFVGAYRNYFGSVPDSATLSAVNLLNIEKVLGPLRELAATLERFGSSNDLHKLILSARKASKGFVGGIFVDIYSFCQQLRALSSDLVFEGKELITRPCDALTAALENNQLIVANADASGCHGLSIYFPYLSDDDEKHIKEDFTKGVPPKIAKGEEIAAALYDVRRQIIKDTEGYYRELEPLKEWYGFIKNSWSRILAEDPDQLDNRYSAEQCVRNLAAAAGKP